MTPPHCSPSQPGMLGCNRCRCRPKTDSQTRSGGSRFPIELLSGDLRTAFDICQSPTPPPPPCGLCKSAGPVHCVLSRLWALRWWFFPSCDCPLYGTDSKEVRCLFSTLSHRGSYYTGRKLKASPCGTYAVLVLLPHLPVVLWFWWSCPCGSVGILRGVGIRR